MLHFLIDFYTVPRMLYIRLLYSRRPVLSRGARSDMVYGSHRITPSKATNAIAFAGNARRKQGRNPRQYPLQPRSWYTTAAASFHQRKRRSPSPSLPPMGSVMRRCLTTSDGYEVSQKIWAEIPPAQKLTAGADRFVFSLNQRVSTS